MSDLFLYFVNMGIKVGKYKFVQLLLFKELEVKINRISGIILLEMSKAIRI